MLTACGGDEWAFEGHVSRSRLWEYHDGLSAPICSSLLDLLDEHATTIGGKIGLTVETSRPLRYYRFSSKEGLATGCPRGAAACAADDAVLSVDAFHAHEQAHVYVFRAWGDSSLSLLNEGVAVALSCSPPYRPLGNISPHDALGMDDWRPLVESFDGSESAYLAAGFWVTYLVQQSGWRKVEQLYRRVRPGTSADDFAIAFAAIFAMSMDQAWSTALSAGGAPACDHQWDCRATRLSPGDIARPDCDGNLHRSIEISDGAGFVIKHHAGLVLHNCADRAAPAYELRSGKAPATMNWVSLPTGAYTILGARGTPLEDVAFVSSVAPPLFAAACAQAALVTLKPDQYAFVNLLPGSVDGCLRLDGGGRRHRVAFLNVALAADATVCESSEPGAPCVAVSTSATSGITIGADAVLRVPKAFVTPSASAPWGQIVFYAAPATDGGV
jgi:hypothetical protein